MVSEVKTNKISPATGTDLQIGDSGDTITLLDLTTSATATLSGAGAIPITGSIAEWTTTGTNAGSLADGVEGQHLFVIMVVDGGVGTLTPTNAGGYSSIAFSDVGDSVHLLFTNGKWYIVGQGGLTTGPLSA